MKTKSRLLCVGLLLGLAHTASAQPMIASPPQSQTNVVGSTVTLSVEAKGMPPLNYQWRRFSANLAGKTNTMLVFTNLQTSNAGNYTVVVTNVEGAVTSGVAFVRVLVPPAIGTQPANQTAEIGETVTFSVTATGTAPFAYQWRFNDADLAGKTAASLVLANVQLTNAGNYSVVVTNAVGSITSRVAVLVFTTVHRIGGITANLDHTISLSLAGVPPRLFAPYYDIFPLEASTNLTEWSPLAILLRTNASLETLSYLDLDAANFDKRFYRTSTNFLVTPFPKPSGPYPVGTVSRLMTDPLRTRNTVPTNSSFMVTFWYPAEARAGVRPDAYVEKGLTLLTPSPWNSPSTVAQFVSHAFAGLPLATNHTSYPVLIYSHGLTLSSRRQNTDKAEELASHGYVVVAVEHMDAFASVFPDGQLVRGTAVWSNDPAYLKPYFDNRIKDILFVLDELSRLNTNDALVGGRLDLDHLGAFGFSLGAATVGEFCRIDARCKAVVLLDAGLLVEAAPDLDRLGLQKPFLSLNGTLDRPDPPPGYSSWLASSHAFLAKATNDAFWCQIQEATHWSFADRGSLIHNPAVTGDPTPASKGQSQAIRACTLSFFDKYLKNQDDHLLDNPAAVYPNIINFQRK